MRLDDALLGAAHGCPRGGELCLQLGRVHPRDHLAKVDAVAFADPISATRPAYFVAMSTRSTSIRPLARRPSGTRKACCWVQ